MEAVNNELTQYIIDHEAVRELLLGADPLTALAWISAIDVAVRDFCRSAEQYAAADAELQQLADSESESTLEEDW